MFILLKITCSRMKIGTKFNKVKLLKRSFKNRYF